MKKLFRATGITLVAVVSLVIIAKITAPKKIPYIKVREYIEQAAEKRGWRMFMREPMVWQISKIDLWIGYLRFNRSAPIVIMSEWHADNSTVMTMAYRRGDNLNYIDIMPRYDGDPEGEKLKSELRNAFPGIDCRVNHR